jgi:hypothetical protein
MAKRDGKRGRARVKTSVVPPVSPADALSHLHDARSVFACAARCLEEITDPHWLEGEDRSVTVDVAVVVRTGLDALDKAAEVLDPRPCRDGDEP